MIPSAADVLRRRAALAGFVVVSVGGTLQYREVARTRDFEPAALSQAKDVGGFYLGLHLQHADGRALPSSLIGLESRLAVSFSIVSVDQAGGPRSLEDFPGELLQSALDRGRVPMITWAPWTSTPGKPNHPDPAANREVVAALLRGELDDDVLAYAERLRELGGPVLLRFAPGADSPKSPWSGGGGHTPSDYRAAWQHVFRLFHTRGASNVGWVWTPASPESSAEYYPGEGFVDWIATDIHDGGAAPPDSERRSFSELYARFRPRFLAYGKPVLVGELGSAPGEGDRAAWYLETLTDIRSRYPEIRGLVVGQGRRAAPDWSGQLGDAIAAELRRLGSAPTVPRPEEPRSTSPTRRKRCLRGAPGRYELIVDGRPFYVRGVAYSPDDWREGRIPLSRRRLEEDFTAIRSMGANTIRRYGIGWYDHNVLTVAHEKDLKVLIGFWLAPDVDYLEDRDAARRYELQVVEAVEALRTYPAVLGWTLGNETWGHLDKHFGQPKLTRARRAYAELVERLAVRIHGIDPARPVMTALEHSGTFPGALRDFARYAPSLDVIAANSYYEPRLAALSATVESFDPSRPYLISEFGPDGYWDHDLGERQSNGLLRERPGTAKAEQYVNRWTQFIAPDRGRNIGGVAYCWRERQEGTATWFGLTDAYDRRKPAYFALRAAWTGEPPAGGPEVFSIQGRADQFEVEEVVEFFADARADDDLVFDWSLRRDEFRDTSADLEPFDAGRAVRVRLPGEPGVYRLYLHVSGADHRVDTASLALRVAPRGWLVARAFRGGR
jgi:cellulose synthase (UDP-forming)